MSNLNLVQIMGRVGKDPETKYTAGGDAVTNLSVATTEKWKDKGGEKQEKTEWHRVVLFGRVAEIAEQYLKKGHLVYLSGRLQTRTYDKDGQKHYSTEIVADKMQLMPNGTGGGGRENEDSEPAQQPARRAAPPARQAPKPAQQDVLDDDIPF